MIDSQHGRGSPNPSLKTTIDELMVPILSRKQYGVVNSKSITGNAGPLSGTSLVRCDRVKSGRKIIASSVSTHCAFTAECVEYWVESSNFFLCQTCIAHSSIKGI